MTTTTPLAPPGAVDATRRRRSHVITDWRPEDPAFWEHTGATVARRNLVFSILSEHVGFSVWTIWSVWVLFLGEPYGFTPAQKFLLTSAPAALGAALRIPYTFAVARFGGRTWTIFSSAVLLVPCVLAGVVIEPGVSFTTLLAVALVAGVGGGNFSSSMANIDAFYPQRLKGWALGLNAGGGNLGVAAVQLVGLAVLGLAGAEHPRLLLAVYIPLIVLSCTCAAWKMDDLAHVANDRRAMRDVARDAHTWIVAFLYIGTFGSFIGFSFAFGQVLIGQFGATPVEAARLTFLGPLLGSLVRPVGGRLADRFGGARVSLLTYAALAAGTGLVLAASGAGSKPLFVVAFVVVFVLTGLGNGAVYKMIPAIFQAKARRRVEAGSEAEAAQRDARRLSRALIGIAGSIGAFGGVLVNLAFREAFLRSGRGDAAYVAFIAFYVACLAVTWTVYLRPSARRLEGV